MKKEAFEIWMMDYLTGALDEQGRKEFEVFLEDNKPYQKQFEALHQTWNQIEDAIVPEPSSTMDDRFFNMLHSEIESSEESKRGKYWLLQLSELFWKPQMAYGILLVFLGLSFGYFINADRPLDPIVKTTIVENQNTKEVHEKLVLTLLEQPSANKRLQAINEANKITKVDETVIKALLQTLNNDANVNVRLAAIASLTNYLDNATVREGLIQSIVKQDSPIVQITLANLMMALQEKKSIEPFKTLIRTKELDKSVKEKLETTIESII